jgi:O-antigen/teichoic acid export membrane protein
VAQPEALQAQAPAESLKKRAASSTLIVLAGFGMGNALRLGSNLVLSRLLAPENFGVMAIVAMFLQGLQMFSDIGIGPAIVQSKRRLDESFLNTAWTLGVVRGGVLFVCMVLVAWPVARLYEHPELMWVLPAVGLNAAVLGFRSTAVATTSRDLLLGRQVVIELVSQIAAIIVMITWAWFDRSVWSLVVGGNVGVIVQVVLTHVALPGIRHRFAWSAEARKELFGFGRWVTASTAFTFLSTQGDRAILSTFVSLATVGVYSVAGNIAQIIPTITGKITSGVLFPVYATWNRENQRDVRDKLVRLRLKTQVPVLLPPCLLAVIAEPAIRLLYDARYQEAGWMLALMSVALVVQTLTTTVEPILLATGDSYGHMALTLSKGVVGFVAMAIGGYFDGIRGVLLGSLVGRALQYPVVAYYLRAKGVWTPWLDAAGLAGAAVFIVAGRALVGAFFD